MDDFVKFWNATHDWEFNPLCKDMYETHAYRFFMMGYKMATTPSISEEEILEMWEKGVDDSNGDGL